MFLDVKILQIIPDWTLDVKQLGLCAAPDSGTLMFVNKNALSSEKITLEHWAPVLLLSAV